MYYTEDAELKENADKAESQNLIFDGTVNLDSSDDNVPRVKGLIELLNQYFADKPVQNH